MKVGRNVVFAGLRRVRGKGINLTKDNDKPIKVPMRGYGNELRADKNASSEADSLDSHPDQGWGPDVLSEQSSIHSYDESIDDSVDSYTPTKITSNSFAGRNVPLTLIQEVSFSFDMDERGSENNCPFVCCDSPSFSSDCKSPSLSTNTLMESEQMLDRHSHRKLPLGLLQESPFQTTPHRNEGPDTSIRAMHNRSVAIESPQRLTRRTLFSRCLSTGTSSMLASKSPRKSPWDKSEQPLHAASPAHAMHRRKNRQPETPR